MRTTRAATVAVMCLVTLGGVVWILSSREPEPVYQDKTLTYWLSDFLPGRKPSPKQIEQDVFAVRQIGTNALPVLLQWSSTRNGPIKQEVISWLNGHPWVPFYLESAVDKNMRAVTGFSILGKSQADAAIPALVEIVKAGYGTRSSGASNIRFPMLALAELDREAAANAGIQLGSNGEVIGWSSPKATSGQ